MCRHKIGGKKNFGWGSKAGYAGINALQYHLCKKYGSLRSHIYRWTIFDRYLREHGIRDTRMVTDAILRSYATTLKGKVDTGLISTSYAVNLLSTVNVTLSLIRGDRALRISPQSFLGRRERIRTTPPAGLDMSAVAAAAIDMIDRNAPREANAILLAREAGMRLREACLLNIIEALSQAEKRAEIRITRGTKGGYGRNMQRLIPVTESLVATIRHADEIRGESECLIPRTLTLIQFINSVHYHWNISAERFGLRKIHDLRAAYACDRYLEITGYPAPVITNGKVLASHAADLKARQIISEEMGHRRIDIIGAYIGGRS